LPPLLTRTLAHPPLDSSAGDASRACPPGDGFAVGEGLLPRARREVFTDAASLLARLAKEGAGLRLCTDLGDVSELCAAARFALESSPPTDDLAGVTGVDELFVFTDGSASAPSASPAAAGTAGALAGLGWAVVGVVVARRSGRHNFVGALFHEAAGSGAAVESRRPL